MYDVAIVSQGYDQTHVKSYVMMELLSQNDASKIFGENSKYKKWEYQKPYITDILDGVNSLFEEGVAHTDLKPANTLFDTLERKATIIDLGGVLKFKNRDELKTFDPLNGFECSKGYTAPELGNFVSDPIDTKTKELNNDMELQLPNDQVVETKTVDLTKAIAFSCGKIIEYVTKESDLPLKEKKIITDIHQALTLDEPSKRPKLSDCLAKIKAITIDANKENQIKFEVYISRMKLRIENNRSSIYLNEDILVTKQVLIDIKATETEPIQPGKKTEKMLEVMKAFLEQKKNRVLLVLGDAGSGKSIALQLKFIEEIYNWAPGKPVPIYFNLANETNLKRIFDNMNKELKTRIELKEVPSENDIMNLFIDSFDEGFEMEKKRETLIKEYFAVLHPQTKIIVTCRTEYVKEDKWFQTDKGEMIKRYVTPIDYDYDEENYSEFLSKKAEMWLNYYQKGHLKEKSLQILRNKSIQSIVKTGFFFNVVMSIVENPKMENLDKLNETEILDLYFDHLFESRLNKLSENQHKILFADFSALISKETKESKIKKNVKSAEIYKEGESINPEKIPKIHEGQLTTADLHALSSEVAKELFTYGVFRLNHEKSEVLKKFDFDNSRVFKDEALYHLFCLLPLKIESRRSRIGRKFKQDVQIGFQHDKIKNRFLVKVLLSELGNNEIKTIGKRKFTYDKQLILSFVLGMTEDDLVTMQNVEAISRDKYDQISKQFVANAREIFKAHHKQYLETLKELKEGGLVSQNISKKKV